MAGNGQVASLENMSETITLRDVLDRFIPLELHVNAGRQSQLRLFVLICLLAGTIGAAGAGAAFAWLGPTLATVVMFVAGAVLMLLPLALRAWEHVDTTVLSGFLLVLCQTVSACSMLGGLTAPTAPLLLPLPVLAYVLLNDKSRNIGLAMFAASLMALVWLDWRLETPLILLTPSLEHAIFSAAIVVAAAALLLALWQLDSLQAYLRDQLRNETLNEQVAAENLDLAKKAAERDSLAKSRLLASVSMDLRAPLTAIIGFSQIIGHELMGPIGHNQYRSYAEDIESSGYKVLETIERVLDLARLQAGEFQLKEESFDLGSMLSELVGELRPMAENSRIRLTIETPPSPFFVYADPRGVRQIVLNLLTNALRYADIGGRAVASLRLGESGEAILSISDDGPGIAPERMPELFNPCAADDGLGMESGAEEWADCAHGLGLPVSRLLAERHGGQLKVESTPGKGTTVTVTLPPLRVSTAVQQYADNQNRRGKSLYPFAAMRAPDGH